MRYYKYAQPKSLFLHHFLFVYTKVTFSACFECWIHTVSNNFIWWCSAVPAYTFRFSANAGRVIINSILRVLTAPRNLVGCILKSRKRRVRDFNINMGEVTKCNHYWLKGKIMYLLIYIYTFFQDITVHDHENETRAEDILNICFCRIVSNCFSFFLNSSDLEHKL